MQNTDTPIPKGHIPIDKSDPEQKKFLKLALKLEKEYDLFMFKADRASEFTYDETINMMKESAKLKGKLRQLQDLQYEIWGKPPIWETLPWDIKHYLKVAYIKYSLFSLKLKGWLSAKLK
jgi:hypothetical protein